MKIIIFGTGSSCENTLSKIDRNKIDIVGFVDNNRQTQGKLFDGKQVYSPTQLRDLDYDLLLIASEYSTEIFNQLLDMGIKFHKIVPVLHSDFVNKLNDKYTLFLKDFVFLTKKNNEKKRVGLIRENNSGSNTFALYKKAPLYIKEKYDIELVDPEKIKGINDYDLVCSTSLKGVYNSQTINVELWHGFPLKKIGTRTELFYNSYRPEKKDNIQKVISSSELYSTLFNASFPNLPEKYEICGFPRNDFLYEKNGDFLNDFFGEDIVGKRIIIYLPTYRKWFLDKKMNGDRSWDNLFGFDEFDNQRFANYLRENNFFFICKLHHMEYNQLNEEIYSNYRDVIRFVKEEELLQKEVDFYEILANSNLLMTDYSSVYFDVLLMNISIVFVPVDLDNYKEKRGFNLEPYDYWTPGPKVFNQIELEKTINESFTIDDYSNKRAELSSIVHKYNDDKSSERVWKVIDELLEERSIS